MTARWGGVDNRTRPGHDVIVMTEAASARGSDTRRRVNGGEHGINRKLVDAAQIAEFEDIM